MTSPGGGSRTVRVRFDGEAGGLRRAAQTGGDAVETWRDKLRRVNETAALASAGVLAAVGAAAKQMTDLAATAEQSLGAVETVFKAQAQQVKDWANGAAQNLGLSANSYRELATLIGSQLKNAGFAMEQVTGKTNDLITKGADLASMFGGTTQEAVEALSAALKGERDPIERYGISLTQASIDAKKAELGLDGLSGAADRQADAMATMALINEQSADATGNFGREADTAAGRAERARAAWENLQTQLGTALLPAFGAIAAFLGGTLIPVLQNNQGTVIFLVSALAGLAAIVLTVNGVVAAAAAVKTAYASVTAGATIVQNAWAASQTAGALATVRASIATKAAAAGQWLLNAALSANPIGLVVIAIAALVAGIVWAWRNCETFRTIVIAAFGAAKAAFFAVLDAGHRVTSWFVALPGRVRGAVGGIGRWLWDSGTSLVDGFLGGIRARWDGLVSWVRGGMQRLRNLWPFSPAREGPFSGAGYVDRSGAALTGDFAASIRRGTPAAASAAQDLMGATRSRLTAPAWLAGPQATTAPAQTPAAAPAPRPEVLVRVYVGDRELKEIIRVEIDEDNRQTRRNVGAGQGRGR